MREQSPRGQTGNRARMMPFPPNWMGSVCNSPLCAAGLTPCARSCAEGRAILRAHGEKILARQLRKDERRRKAGLKVRR